ncbi:unnamed protein product [Lymnaea stagnalis]|uniref:Lipase maturation factor n=1 Tax=Lymnaea stagnalis TaxID=6523 RepID=A0AAV2I230_LYMST
MDGDRSDNMVARSRHKKKAGQKEKMETNKKEILNDKAKAVTGDREPAAKPENENEKSTSLTDVSSKQLLENGTKLDSNAQDLRGSYWLTRMVIVRYMGFIYFVAYSVSLNSNKQLLGKDGLLPANQYLNNIRSHVGSSSWWSLVSAAPTLLWFVDYETHIDWWLDTIAWVGLAIAVFMMMTGAGNWPLLLLEWILYHSLVTFLFIFSIFVLVCHTGWESQVLETGFLTTFLCPLLSLASVPKSTPPSKIIIFAYRWLIFRIMLGAGLIKIRGDKCWHDLTCMNYHYETQPVPNPLSYYLHQSPEPIHKFEVLSNHFVELVAPFLLLLPLRRPCMIGGVIQIIFQARVVLIISGNLSFLNWLTILPSLACFDDASLSWLFSMPVKSAVGQVNLQRKNQNKGPLSKCQSCCYVLKLFNISFGLLIAYLSIPVVQNLLSTRQAMNTSFDPLRLVNTYGAFGSITKKRTEVIFQGTNSSNPDSPAAVWEEYQFNCKPGDVSRTPCVISPYHYRLDWLMWFAAFQNYNHNPWLVHLAAKFLVNDEKTESLIAYNPFHGRPPPKFVRAEHYRYVFTKIGSPEAKSGHWWKRKRIGSYLPPVSLHVLSSTLAQMGWAVPKFTKG